MNNDMKICEYCGREVRYGDFCRHCFDDDYLSIKEPWSPNDVVINETVTANDFNEMIKDNSKEN